MIDVPYEEQTAKKQQLVEELIGDLGRVDQIIRMKNPDHYRNKVTSVFAPDRKGKPVCGIYKAGTHEVVPVKSCLIEDTRADRIIQTVFALAESFKIRVYDEDRGTGLLRYVQVRTARGTRQVMVTLVTADTVFPPAKKFVNALIKRHPEITTVIQNINDKQTTMVLGEREKVLYGPGYIEDILCKKRFRISSRSFYQVNSLQTEKLYNIALDYAGFSGKERILDAYCGIGTQRRRERRSLQERCGPVYERYGRQKREARRPVPGPAQERRQRGIPLRGTGAEAVEDRLCLL